MFTEFTCDIIIIIITTKALIKVTQSQLYNCYWGTVQTHCHWSGNDCRKSVCLSFCQNVATDGAANHFSELVCGTMVNVHGGSAALTCLLLLLVLFSNSS